MTSEIYSQITQQFDFLKDVGLQFSFTETKGKLGDRDIHTFIYDNPTLHKRFEIVYCRTDSSSMLYGYMIKYSSLSKDTRDVHNFIPFNRLRCFFEEGSDIIFFGNEQYSFSYQLKEFKLVIEKFISCVISNDWIDYNKLLSREEEIYVFASDPKRYYAWADEIKSNEFVKSSTNIVYDSSVEPSYETYGLRLRAKNQTEFHITHGYRSRDDVGFAVQVIYPDGKSETHDFMNRGASDVVEFIRQRVN